jgi:hypothetical protein
MRVTGGSPLCSSGKVRRCWAVGDIDWLRHQDQWVGLKSIVKVEARRIRAEAESRDVRYYISSLAPTVWEPDLAVPLLAAVRGHWGIENQVHHRYVAAVRCWMSVRRGPAYFQRIAATFERIMGQPIWRF